MTAQIDLAQAAAHLNANTEYKEETVKTVDPVLKVEVVQMRASARISPRGTYSSAEFDQTVSVSNASVEELEQIRAHLKAQVIEHTIAMADQALAAAHNKGML